MTLDGPPFSKAHQLNSELVSHQELPWVEKVTHLPGHPEILLGNFARLTDFLGQEFHTLDLDKLAPHLWMMSTQSSANISPLHHQKVKGRTIIIAEYPRLHLVWIHDRVFLKPIPRYLLSYHFWADYLTASSILGDEAEFLVLGDEGEGIRKAALGYLRTYRFLIKHESDFKIAQHNGLISHDVKWPDFLQFISEFHRIQDSQVSARYAYGELRLSRLNIYGRIFLRQFQFEQIHGQYSDYFSRYYGPLLFVFGILSVALSAMQVEMAVEALDGILPWKSLRNACRWFSVISLSGVLLLGLVFLFLALGMIANEWIFAIKVRLRKRRRQSERNLEG
ncbi:hypothetical protein MMC07_004601 [Pseudocyphellaria aurata]|nr:hypothetical protein [Pseudocyphellaria aurata]